MPFLRRDQGLHEDWARMVMVETYCGAYGRAHGDRRDGGLRPFFEACIRVVFEIRTWMPRRRTLNQLEKPDCQDECLSGVRAGVEWGEGLVLSGVRVGVEWGEGWCRVG